MGKPRTNLNSFAESFSLSLRVLCIYVCVCVLKKVLHEKIHCRYRIALSQTSDVRFQPHALSVEIVKLYNDIRVRSHISWIIRLSLCVHYYFTELVGYQGRLVMTQKAADELNELTPANAWD